MILWDITGSLIFALYRILSLLLLTAIPIILIGLIVIFFQLYDYIQSDECLVIYHQNKMRAFVAASDYSNYSYIRYLIVSNVYRERGLGSYLIHNVNQNLNYPIYLMSFPQSYLLDFYRNLGFVQIHRNQLPRRIRQYFNDSSQLIPMMLENNLEFSTTITSN